MVFLDSDLFLRLATGLVAGAVLGLDRNLHGKSAGMRTLGLVALGAAAATSMVALEGHPSDALSRVMQGVLTGVGFLGVGVIGRQPDRERAQGLTTAAAVWLAAVLGAGAGAGYYVMVAMTLGLALLVLLIGGPLERALQRLIKGDARAAMKHAGRDAKVGADKSGPPPPDKDDMPSN
jgi:putative Mg2+ transporter-C (MgtC) family protein